MVGCGSHHLCLPQPPMSLAEGCWLGQYSTWEHISSELLRYSQLERTVCHLSHKDVFPSCARPSHWPMGATCCYAQPLLRNSSILCLLFSGLIAGRPNMALFKCFCSCFLASWTFLCIQRELGLEWEPVAPHHGSWLLFSSLWGSCKWGIFLPRVWCLEKEGQLPPQ